MKTPIFNLFEEAFFLPCPTRPIGHLTVEEYKSADRVRKLQNVTKKRMVSKELLILTTAAFVRSHMVGIAGECRLERALQGQVEQQHMTPSRSFKDECVKARTSVQKPIAIKSQNWNMTKNASTAKVIPANVGVVRDPNTQGSVVNRVNRAIYTNCYRLKSHHDAEMILRKLIISQKITLRSR